MKRTLIVFALLCTFFIVILGYGYSLPVEHQITMQRHYEQKTPDDIWAVIANHRKYSQWREDVYEITEIPSRGKYDAWKEVDANGHSVPYEIIGHSPGKQLIIEITDASLPYGGTWTFDLLPDATGTTVKITEHGSIDNLLLRVFAHFVTGYTSDMNSWLNSLDNKFAMEARLPKYTPAVNEVIAEPQAPQTAPDASHTVKTGNEKVTK